MEGDEFLRTSQPKCLLAFAHQDIAESVWVIKVTRLAVILVWRRPASFQVENVAALARAAV